MELLLLLAFTVAGLIVSEHRIWFPVVCYASALAWVAVGLAGPWLEGPGPGCLGSVEAGIILRLFFTLPIPATMIGLGTGSLCNHPLRGAMIAFASTLSLQIAFVTASHS